MIIGFVTPDQLAVIRFQTKGPTGLAEEIEAVIDTGFSGFLTLPSAVIAGLGLVAGGVTQVILADGSNAESNSYIATIMWNEKQQEVEVLEVARGHWLAWRF